MTDPETSDRTYIEPLSPEVLTKIIEKERPDAVLPTLGEQTAAPALPSSCITGAFSKSTAWKCSAPKADVIAKAEDRGLFKDDAAD
ncbi:MAG: hypothetical protein U1D30_13745 [Planctomycetota bacterium]